MEVMLLEETAIMATTRIAKRRRTKRQRRIDDANVTSFMSPASSGDSSGERATEEEKDMANCLILLAQGWPGWPPAAAVVAGNPTGKAARRCLYECKTCSRCFSSFQALGGHRAGHKKPKTTTAKPEKYENEKELSPAPATRVHECSICGSEFASGQALGGHMRRHRSAMIGLSSSSSSTTECKKEGGSLGLDLNLPASPEVVAGEFGFAGKGPMVLTALTQLVDCHY